MKKQNVEILVLKSAIVFLLFATSISYCKVGASFPDWGEKVSINFQKEQSVYVLSSSEQGSLVCPTLCCWENLGLGGRTDLSKTNKVTRKLHTLSLPQPRNTLTPIWWQISFFKIHFILFRWTNIWCIPLKVCLFLRWLWNNVQWSYLKIVDWFFIQQKLQRK